MSEQTQANPEGYLLVDKPQGWTSFDVVAKVRGALQRELRQATGERCKLKVGHIGTLDPMATGLLVLMVGKYTKRVPEFIKQDKTYQTELKLGLTSTTGDSEGELTAVSDAVPTEEEVQKVIQTFVGEQMQTPPAYSAIKVDGQRAYKLARQGKKVELKPRPVTINSITDISYKYPKITFTCDVSSGTYIRSLVEDIGEQLGAGAYMSALRRTKIGDFLLNNAIDPASVEVSELKRF